MGDMKTPDFEDLLAAFDIPDIDANEAMHPGHEETDGHVKQPPGEVGASDHALPHADITTVSVIVKHTVCPEQHEADGHAMGSRLLQNGFSGGDAAKTPSARPTEASAPALSRESWHLKEKGSKPLDTYPHFSAEDPAALLMDQPSECKPKEKSQLVASPPAAFSLSPPQSVDSDSAEESKGPPSPGISQDDLDGDALLLGSSLQKIGDVEARDAEAGGSPVGTALTPRESPKGCGKPVPAPFSPARSPGPPWPGLDPGPASLPEVKVKCSPSSPSSRFQPAACLKAPASPKEGLAGPVKEEPLDSPVSISSEGEEEDETGSPSSTSSRPLKVRIKTIKTTSGSITRTVTRVSSDSDPGASKPTSEANPPEAASETTAVKQEEGTVPVPKKKLDLSSVPKVEGPQIVSLQLGNGAKIKGTILPVSTIQNASSAMLMAASVAQQKAVVLPASQVVAKSIISLVPQPLPKAVGRTNVSIVTQAATNTTTTSTTIASPKGSATVVMVPAQKPLPAVAGTVISRTQSNLVEAFNKILNSKNLLPTYKPNLSPPLESCLSLPLFGYRCLECGDAFSLEKSLVRHYDRRSMRIEVTCNHCTKRLVFFNKCSLLLHAREHKDKGLVMQCSHLVMRPIALDQMIGPPDITPLVSVATLPPGKMAAPAPEAVAVANGGQDAAVLPLSSGCEQATFSTFRCQECKEQCKNKAGLAAHFQLVGATGTVASTVCTLCPMMMPNRCSFNAHHRMHKHRPPHVCPECGGIFRMANFQSHLKEACLHFSRRVGYRCPSCAVVFGGVNSIKSHIQNSHCEVFHKCPICPMAFKSAPSAHGHVYTQHPGFSNQQSKMIYKCAMCDTVFTHKPLLSSHFDQHLISQRVSVFKCPTCPLLFAQKRTMLEHLKSTHSSAQDKEEAPKQPDLLTPKEEPTENPVSKASEEEESSSSSSSEDPPSSPEPPKKGKSGAQRKVGGKRLRSNCWKCGICHSWFPERDEYVTHMKKEHGKSVKKFPCRLCERSFCSAPSLRRHVRVNHEGIKRVYPCKYCTEGKCTFSSRLILEKHIQVRHGIKVPDQIRSEEILVTRNGGSAGAQVPQRKRKLSGEEGESCNEEPDSTTPPSKTPKADNSKASFRCWKCGYIGSSWADFQEHIPQHRTDESSHQCRKCGLCFTSPGSLSRHRFITHKMKGTGDEEEEEEADPRTLQDGDSPEGKLSCKVCGKAFDNQLNLKTHFRTHGMAFIKQRQNVGLEN
ncbi:zinc finger protein 687 [Rhinatrema bivittatum]|uniref:zinc finger protein 687 n=1 Tax=Rhinatrema bivittatum TaxID=194408 RepID=UPI001127B556|nr:zinc finger protein 687 [Rhinatrema bivittatum]XP_029436557.1 zinc finger protein 687 [Rhinatrema bivittatum]XP_029436558.1 zinc finger protein 687 [Rhinatrema bivittatum]XP_029436559.1 zinc finger protein 687 [Rhinatrema bivittatum]